MACTTGCPIFVGAAWGSVIGGASGAGITTLMGGEYEDIADGFYRCSIKGAIEGGVAAGYGLNVAAGESTLGFGRFFAYSFGAGEVADFGFGSFDAIIEG